MYTMTLVSALTKSRHQALKTHMYRSLVKICWVVCIKSKQSAIAIDCAPSFLDTIFLGLQRTTDANESCPALM